MTTSDRNLAVADEVSSPRDRLVGGGEVGRAVELAEQPRVQERGVSYAALNVPTALAEVFQRTRVIDARRRSPYLAAWSPTRTMTLLDLTRFPIVRR